VANRSYLYTTDHLPESSEWEANKNLHSISEWGYDIPLVFKLLLTGNPLAVKSSIWGVSEKIALAGEFQIGLGVLEEYFARLPAEAEPLINEARSFLSKISNQRKYFILECGEIFDMEEGSLYEKNLSLIEEINELKSNISNINVPKVINVELPKRGLLDRLLGKKQVQPKSDSLKPFYPLGLGNWSNVLYFQFDG